MQKTIEYYNTELNNHYQRLRDIESKKPSEFAYKQQRLQQIFELLFNRFCPYHVGDRVQLKKTPIIEDRSGWQCAKHFLVEGAKASVRYRDYAPKENLFVFYLIFDDASWIDTYGTIHMTEPNKRGLFCFPEDFLEPTDEL